jgi:hypothetical protein
MARFLKPPATAQDLRRLVVRQIEAVFSDLAVSEFDRRALFRDVGETDVRAFLGDALRLRSHGWYTVTQETVTAGEKRMDLRIEARAAHDEIVIVEIKLAGWSWKGDELVDHLETQLVDQYLISRRVRHGLYLVINLGVRSSWAMADGTDLDFDQLIARLSTDAKALLASRAHIDGLEVMGQRIAVPPRKTRKPRGPSATTAPSKGNAAAAAITKGAVPARPSKTAKSSKR